MILLLKVIGLKKSKLKSHQVIVIQNEKKIKLSTTPSRLRCRNLNFI